MIGVTPHERAYLAPFLTFLGLMLLGEVVKNLGDGYAYWALAEPRYWMFPLQIVVCGGQLIHYRRYYTFGPVTPGGLLIGGVAGALALGIWIAPQWLFGAAPRGGDGFLPHYFGADGWRYGLNLGARLFRMVVIVALVEEIFWRGFLLRWVVRDDFERVPMGAFTWRSFLVVSVAFCFEHNLPDWPAALLTSMLYCAVAYQTKSLLAVVVAHAVTNGLLAIYVIQTKQWGFW
jgi:CAAX prenyl protease-like protein